MRLCLGGLNWPPEAFWRATPREVALALGAGASAAIRTGAPNRASFERLMRHYPDERARKEEDGQ
ncbi:phage tail assembly chaperone [Stappia taiwanensis]|uniref:Phage tail assembly chaperone n=1 Tax=Stappia taiwanensis TaxID=992267 RepID=A0A838XK63_9HYPH|nr:phage tail assembly chaperone [Stappia taiwanensis]MBA4610925.1 phage tail assembly chaperone [Stappia taiwanensis]